RKHTWNLAVKLGPRAFETISGEVVNVALLSITESAPLKDHKFCGIDALLSPTANSKALLLRTYELQHIDQDAQITNPDSRIILEEMVEGPLLFQYADAYWGQGTGDFPRFGRCFWEVPVYGTAWELMQSTVPDTVPYGGREQIVLWEQGKGQLVA